MKQKIRTSAMFAIPVALVVLAVIYTPGTEGKLVAAWSFILGAFFGAELRALIAARKNEP